MPELRVEEELLPHSLVQLLVHPRPLVLHTLLEGPFFQRLQKEASFCQSEVDLVVHEEKPRQQVHREIPVESKGEDSELHSQDSP